MSKFIKLLTSAYVNGRLRHPHEGTLHLEDEEAQRLLENQSATDVSKDFEGSDHSDAPIEGLRAASDDAVAAATLTPIEHQANIAPETAPAADAPAPAKKETVK